MKKYKGYLIAPAAWVQSPTTKPFKGLVVLCSNMACLADRFETIDECTRFIDDYVIAGEPEPEAWACMALVAQLPGKVGAA